MSTSVKNALIVGGGIGGLSTAIALADAGVDVHLVEKSTSWGVYGVGIIQPGNALRALHSIGVLDECLAVGFAYSGHAMFTSDGSPLGPPLEFPVPPDAPWPAMNGITRPLLHEILKGAASRAGVRASTGVSFESITQNDETGKQTVILSDGTTDDYDLIVGADGIYSKVREALFGADIQPEYVGQVVWRYNVKRPPHVDRLRLYVGPNGTAMLVPISQELAYIGLIEIPADGTSVRDDREGLAAAYRAALAPYGGDIATIRDSEIVDDRNVIFRKVESLFVPDWHRGSAVLIGDAAHAAPPSAGQGAAQAIEDGVALADEVTKGGTVEEILDRFVARRLERCRYIVEQSLQLSKWDQGGAPSREAVDELRDQINHVAYAAI